MLFNHVAQFNNFACIRDRASPNPYENIEILHNAIHTAVGGKDSHIKETSLAAFDPLFYLHHACVSVPSPLPAVYFGAC